MNSDLGTHRSQWKQWLAAFGATSIFLSSSLDTVWTSRRGDIIWGVELVMNASFIIIGAILGAIFADIYGRRITLLVASIFVIPRTGSLIFVGAESSWLNRSAMDIGSGIACTVVPLYISEIADINIRGTLMVLQFPIFILGSVVSDSAEVLFDTRNIMQLNGIINIVLLLTLTLFHVITLGMLPETPHFLNWKKRYTEAADSLAFFRGVKNVQVIEASSEAFTFVQSTTKEHSWMEKIRGIFRLENRRSLAIIASLIAINWTSRIEFGFVPKMPRNMGAMSFALLIGSWIGKLVFSIGTMFTINIIERKLSLLLMISVGCISTIMIMTPLMRYHGVEIPILSFLSLFHVVLTAVTLSYLGKFFPVNVKSIASAALVSFAVLTRNLVFTIQVYLYPTLLVPVIISVLVLLWAVLFIWVFFPNSYNLPCSEIMIEITAGAENDHPNNA